MTLFYYFLISLNTFSKNFPTAFRSPLSFVFYHSFLSHFFSLHFLTPFYSHILPCFSSLFSFFTCSLSYSSAFSLLLILLYSHLSHSSNLSTSLLHFFIYAFSLHYLSLLSLSISSLFTFSLYFFFFLSHSKFSHLSQSTLLFSLNLFLLFYFYIFSRLSQLSSFLHRLSMLLSFYFLNLLLSLDFQSTFPF